MPFCTSCGRKSAPGQKFCEECGLPLDLSTASGTPPVSRPAQGPLPVPQQKVFPSRQALIATGAVAVVVIITVFYFFGMPLVQGMTKQGGGSKSTVSETPVVTPEVTAAPVPFTTAVTSTPATATMTATPAITLEGRYEETYEEIYRLNQEFMYGQKAEFRYDLARPPLFIKFNLTPTMITRPMMVDIGLSTEHMINATYASPLAWFEIKVLDAGSGAVVDQQGYNRDYSEMTKQEFMVRKPGNYRIEMSGSEVKAEMRFLIGTPDT